MRRWLLYFLLILLCVPTARSQESEQSEASSNGAEMLEIPLVYSEGADVVIGPGWYISGATAKVVQEGAADGRYCLYITTTKRENPWDEQLFHSGHVFRKDKIYTLTAYLRSPDKLRIGFKPSMEKEPKTGYGTQSFTMTETWQEYHVTTPPMPEDVSPARVIFQLAYDNGEFYIDSVRFYEGEYMPYKPESVGHIEGMLTMLDDTPHVAVPVQAIRNGKVIATTLSDDAGRYKLINLKPGRYQVRCQVLGGYVYYEKSGNGRKWEYEEVEGIDLASLGEFLKIDSGSTLQDIDF